jgi:dipeptidyl aminopeptidase/acylaminoacyl peptidase
MTLQSFISACLLALSTTAFSQTSSLELAEIMKGEGFIGYSPENTVWSMTGERIYFDWNPENKPDRSNYFYDLKTKQILKTTAENYLSDPEYTKINDENASYFVLDNQLYRYDSKLKKSTVIYSVGDAIYSLSYSKVTKMLYFYSNSHIFRYDPREKSIQSIAHFVKGDKPTDPDSSLLMKEEFRLFDYHQSNQEKKLFQESTALKFNQQRTIYTGKASQRNVQISTSEKYILFRLDFPEEQKSTEYMDFMSSGGHAQSAKARSKVSGSDPKHQLAIFNIETDSLYFADFSTLPDIRKKAAYLLEGENKDPFFENDRKIVPHPLHFSSENDDNFLDVRSYDNKDRWIVTMDLQTGKVRCYDHQHDEAWIGGPGISSWNMAEGNLGWIIDGKQFYFQSEKTGYSHLYRYDVPTQTVSELTSGNWEVHEVYLSNDRRAAYLQTNRSHPGNRDLEKIDLVSGKISYLLNGTGYHDALLSPDEKNFVVRYSYKNKPWELYLSKNMVNSQLQQITSSTSALFQNYKWYEPEVIPIANETEEGVYTRVYKPENPNGAAVIFVHGAGYLQNAHNYWSTYHREYMFHNLLRDQGFTIIDMDYRASEGYGRDHRTAIYRHMGGADLRDHLYGRNYLIDSLGVDSSRIGIYGGSYGGFITLMALLTEPGKFKSGAALRAVTDWMHYNHEYTSNILNYPDTDSEAYRKSSPINYAQNLQDELLILHGMVDDNVQFQDVVRLAQRFIELGKKNWDLAVYPVEAHGFTSPTSWADEYRRILELFQLTLLND